MKIEPAQICIAIFFIVLICGHYINEHVKMCRLCDKMEQLGKDKVSHEILILNNCKSKDTSVAKAYEMIYSHYILYMQARYSKAGKPNNRGDLQLYNLAKVKGNNSFFIISFYIYMTRFFGGHVQKTNEEYEIYRIYNEELKEIYDSVSSLRNSLK